MTGAFRVIPCAVRAPLTFTACCPTCGADAEWSVSERGEGDLLCDRCDRAWTVANQAARWREMADLARGDAA